MNNSIKILSDIAVHTKYAKYLPNEERRETFEEIATRNMEMHIKKFPNYKDKLEKIYKDYVLTKKVLPSMRSMQFAGKPIDVNPSRIYNCAYLPIDDWRAFHETMFLLLGGTGVGFSVQHHHIEQLPEIRKPNPNRKRRFLISDSIEGWADAIKILMRSFFEGTSTITFDYSDIREKGAMLVTSGGKAPGPEPLRICITKIGAILREKENGSKLSSFEVHRIICLIADAVLAGGIRRAALISLFSANDTQMINCKSGNWWELYPELGRANNSAALLRHRIEKEEFLDLWKKIELSNAGEPGIYLTNDKDWGTNPCCEIALRPYQFCNLVEINASNIESQEDYLGRCEAAAFIGTLQASYTDFHYLRPIWQRNTEKDALLGVSMTGIASMKIFDCNIEDGVKVIRAINKITAKEIGINPSARLTAVKPAGTTSLVLGTSSGIHAWHNDYYIRRMQLNKNEAIYSYLLINHPDLIEDYIFDPEQAAVVSIPQKAPDGAVTRHETAIDLLERVKEISKRWVKPGHIDGQNTHNVSATVSIDKNQKYLRSKRGFEPIQKVKDTDIYEIDLNRLASNTKVEDALVDEWQVVGEWMWENKEFYNGLSVLPKDLGSYQQTPFEDITKEQYEKMISSLTSVDLTKVIETQDNTNQKGELACSGPLGCEIT